MTEAALNEGSLRAFVQTDHRVEVYGFYTPVGRCLQTTFALTMGQLLARQKRVLYLNFESCAGLAEMLARKGEAEFLQVLYYLQEEPEEFLSVCIRRWKGSMGWIWYFLRHVVLICMR